MRCCASPGILSLVLWLSASMNGQEPFAARASPHAGRLEASAVETLCLDRQAPRAAEDTMRAAIRLLPEQPAYVSLIDVRAQEDRHVRKALRPLEAFTLPRKAGVYVNLDSRTLRRAVSTRDQRLCRFDVHVLATIVWHEMAHIAGADEAGAQAREEELWEQFLREGRIDRELGLRQLRGYSVRKRK